MNSRPNRFRAGVLSAGLLFACATAAMAQSAGSPEIPEQRVRFAHAPYIDTSAAFIGMEKGWFDEVGVVIDDQTLFTPIENAASFIASGSADVVDAGLVQILPSMNTIPDVRVFTHHDIFQGQAIMGQSEYKTVDDFVGEGMSLDEAIKSAVAQMEGKNLLLAPDPASSNFARVFLGAGGLDISDTTVITADYRQHLPLMLAGRADFENGGGPTIIQMLKNGFDQVIQTKHLIEQVDPTEDIGPLTSIVLNGYVASTDFIENNYPTVLRIASVNYRIADFIAMNPEEAAAIHGPFLNRYGGSQLETEDVVLLYTEIDPFFGFDGQSEWYHDESSPYFWKHWVQAVIDSSEEQGVITPGEWTPETIELSHQLYRDLEGYRDEARSLIDEHSAAIEAKGGAAAEFLAAAKRNFEIFNYYDAARFAKEAVALSQAG
jgi:ABC-type nitrate/sulfonate/bicarbonate transport system substrate-binding protein